MRNRLTALEIVEADHPGILLMAKQALDKGKSCAFVAGALNREFSLSLTKSTVEKYRKKRWQVDRDNLNQQKKDFHQLASEIKDGDLNEAAKALLFESVRKLNPQTLLGIMRINVQRDNLRLKKKALKQLQKTELPQKELTPEEYTARAIRVTNAVKAIFGLGEYRVEDAWPKGSFLLLDSQGKGQLPIADTEHNLSQVLLDCVHAQLCNPSGFHGRIYDGPDKPQAIARLKDLFAFQHIPWPGDSLELPQVQAQLGSDRDPRPLS